MAEIFIIALFALLGVIAHRAIGFGIAPFLSPVALIFLSPPVAVVTTILVGTLSCLMVLYQSRNNWEVMPAIIKRIVVAAIPGLIVGSYIVTRIDKAWLQIILGIVVVLAVLIQEFMLPKPTRSLGVTKGITLSGLLSGLFNAMAANGAPPTVMWLRSHISSPDQIRQNMSAIFIGVNLCSLTAIYLLRPETYGLELTGMLALFVPLVIAGNIIGTTLMKKINVKLFEKLIVVLIVFTGLVSIGLGASNFI